MQTSLSLSPTDDRKKNFYKKVIDKLNDGKSDADKKKLEEEAKKCDGYAEMEKIMKEGMN